MEPVFVCPCCYAQLKKFHMQMQSNFIIKAAKIWNGIFKMRTWYFQDFIFIIALTIFKTYFFSREKEELNNKFVSAKIQLKESESELKQMQSKFSESSESCTNLKNLLEATQQV
jgi:hypothetical protein